MTIVGFPEHIFTQSSGFVTAIYMAVQARHSTPTRHRCGTRAVRAEAIRYAILNAIRYAILKAIRYATLKAIRSAMGTHNPPLAISITMTAV